VRRTSASRRSRRPSLRGHPGEGRETRAPFLVETLRAIAEGTLAIPPRAPVDLTAAVEGSLADTRPRKGCVRGSARARMPRMTETDQTCPDCGASFELADNYCRQCGMYVAALRSVATVPARSLALEPARTGLPAPVKKAATAVAVGTALQLAVGLTGSTSRQAAKRAVASVHPSKPALAGTRPKGEREQASSGRGPNAGRDRRLGDADHPASLDAAATVTAEPPAATEGRDSCPHGLCL
jgi:hypothetical protein